MSYASAVLADGPALFWQLNDPSGTTLADSSGNNHPLTLSGTGATLNQTSLLPNSEGASINWTPNTAVAACAAPYGSFTAALGQTYEGWFNTSVSGTGNPELWADNGSNGFLQLRLSATGKLEIILFDGGGSHQYDSLATVNDGVTRYFAITTNGSNVGIYLNGVQDSFPAAAFTFFTPDNANSITVGARSAGNNEFTGKTQNFAYYNKPLTPTQVALHWAAAAAAAAVPQILQQLRPLNVSRGFA